MKNHQHLPARVNITLNSVSDTAQEKKELPMRLLVLADFTRRAQTLPLAKRERLAVTLANYQQVLSYLNPKLTLSVATGIESQQTALSVNVSIQSMQDFHPSSLIEQVPVLQRLNAMRMLLKELRANLIDNVTFRKKLQALLADKSSRVTCHAQLQALRS